MAKYSIRLVYGGGNIGLMGVVADAVMQGGGDVTGVIPGFLMKKEVGHRGITDLEVVESMHQRKQRMADLADAFVALPGGWGTLEEVAEILTWRQLGLVNQPVFLLNINGFFDPLLDQMRLMVKEGFLSKTNFELLQVENTPEKIISILTAYKA
jgi:uncharacterized protein (TIGR00730 family)